MNIQPPNKLFNSLASASRASFLDFNKKLSFSKSIMLPKATLIATVINKLILILLEIASIMILFDYLGLLRFGRSKYCSSKLIQTFCFV